MVNESLIEKLDALKQSTQNIEDDHSYNRAIKDMKTIIRQHTDQKAPSNESNPLSTGIGAPSSDVETVPDVAERVALAIDTVLGIIDIDPDELPECLLDFIGYSILRIPLAKAAIAAMGEPLTLYSAEANEAEGVSAPFPATYAGGNTERHGLEPSDSDNVSPERLGDAPNISPPAPVSVSDIESRIGYMVSRDNPYRLETIIEAVLDAARVPYVD